MIKCLKCGADILKVQFKFDNDEIVTVELCGDCCRVVGGEPWREDREFHGHCTSAIANWTQQAVANGVKRELAFVHWISFMIGIWRNWQSLTDAPPGADRARWLHKKIDEAIAETLASDPKAAATVACKAGCHHCCYTAVAITEDEGDLLLDTIVEKGIEIDVPKLKRQWGPAASDSHWANRELIKHADKRCVLLGDDGLCQVYEQRPAACRKYMVADKPELCDMETFKDGPVKTLMSHNAEVLTSAAYNLDQHLGLLPRVLGNRVKKDKDGNWNVKVKK